MRALTTAATSPVCSSSTIVLAGRPFPLTSAGACAVGTDTILTAVPAKGARRDGMNRAWWLWLETVLRCGMITSLAAVSWVLDDAWRSIKTLAIRSMSSSGANFDMTWSTTCPGRTSRPMLSLNRECVYLESNVILSRFICSIKVIYSHIKMVVLCTERIGVALTLDSGWAPTRGNVIDVIRVRAAACWPSQLWPGAISMKTAGIHQDKLGLSIFIQRKHKTRSMHLVSCPHRSHPPAYIHLLVVAPVHRPSGKKKEQNIMHNGDTHFRRPGKSHSSS